MGLVLLLEWHGMSRSRRKSDQVFHESVEQGDVLPFPKVKRVAKLTAKTEAQSEYIHSIECNTLTFGVGPAGTGKTFVCASIAAELLQKKQIQKLILTRPAQEAGERLGFLPGSMEEKYAPYLRPFFDVLNKRLGEGFVDCALKNGKIEMVPLGFMRGMTFENCMVILDEAQNTSPKQMKMFLTRIGEHCKVVVNGDPRQIDIPGPSGLMDGLNRSMGIAGVGSVSFTEEDCVRSGIVRALLDRYSHDNDDSGLKRFVA